MSDDSSGHWLLTILSVTRCGFKFSDEVWISKFPKIGTIRFESKGKVETFDGRCDLGKTGTGLLGKGTRAKHQ